MEYSDWIEICHVYITTVYKNCVIVLIGFVFNSLEIFSNVHAQLSDLL